jgi:hypothetical protein
MRGWPSVVTTERDCQQYQTGILLASAEPEIIRKVLQKLQREFPKVAFTLLGPRAYKEIFGKNSAVVWLEDIKSNPLEWIVRTRQHQFDVAVIVWAGQPTFRKAKAAGLFLNPRRWIIYDENAEQFVADRANWMRLLHLISSRWNRHRPGPILHPFGLIYLLITTAGLARRTGRIVRGAK